MFCLNRPSFIGWSHAFICYMAPIMLVLAFFYRDLSLAIYWLVAFFALISIFYSGAESDNQFFITCALSCFAFGLYQWGWAELCKSSTEFTGAYGNYRNAAKILVCTSFTLLAIPSLIQLIHAHLRKFHFFILLTSLTLILGCLIEFCVFNHFSFQQRVALNLSRATGSAYALVFVFLLSFNSLIYLYKRNYFLHFLFFALTLSCLILTQTRAAILAYPVLCFIFYVSKVGPSKKNLCKLLLTVALTMTTLFFMSKPILVERYYEFVDDIQLYEAGNTRTSVGARLAMAEVGLKSSNQNLSTLLLGQSIEDRNTYIQKLIKRESQLNGALPYLSVHLHNEMIDMLSLKGLIGVFFLLSFYISLFISSCKIKSPLCFCLTLSVITFGISDLIFYSKSSIVVALCLFIAFLIEYTKFKYLKNGKSF